MACANLVSVSSARRAEQGDEGSAADEVLLLERTARPAELAMERRVWSWSDSDRCLCAL